MKIVQVIDLYDGVLNAMVARIRGFSNVRILGYTDIGVNHGDCYIGSVVFDPSEQDLVKTLRDQGAWETKAPRVPGGFHIAHFEGGPEQQGVTKLEAIKRAYVAKHYPDGVLLEEIESMLC